MSVLIKGMEMPKSRKSCNENVPDYVMIGCPLYVQPKPSTDIQDVLGYLDDVLHPLVSPDNWNVYSELHDMISRLPSAQPNIVRCKDCKWYELPSHKITENCVRWMKSNGILLPIKPNDYCSYAERITDEQV